MIFQWIPTTIKDSWFGNVKLDYYENGYYADVWSFVEDSGRDYQIHLSSPSDRDGWYCTVLSAKADGVDPFETEEEVEDCGFHVKQFIEGMFQLCRSMPLKEGGNVI